MGSGKPRQFLSDEQVERFHTEGFIAIETPIARPEEVAVIKRSLIDLFTRRVGWREGAQYDHIGLNLDRDDAQSLPQIIDPSVFASPLQRLAFRKQALAIAQQLLGPTATESFEHAILKPAHVGPETPWHQDEAYRVDPSFEYQQLSIWMPTDDVNVDNGCMHYIPLGKEQELLSHAPLHGDSRRHALECTGDFDAGLAVPCPLQAGGITIHSGLTLHYAGPNNTGIPRYAYVLGFETPPVPATKVSKHLVPWQSSRKTANWLRRRAWIMRGGFVRLMIIKARRSGLSPHRLSLLVRRGIRYLVRVWVQPENRPYDVPPGNVDNRPEVPQPDVR